MAPMEGTCWHCGHPLSEVDYARENRCPGCGRATHACRNCRFFMPGKPNECMEPLVERVVEKDRANFCDYFEAARRNGEKAGPSADELRQAAEDLFK